MRYIPYHVTLFGGEHVIIRLLPDGRSVCPVCGALNTGEPAYSSGELDSSGHRKSNPPDDIVWANGSMDICPSCNTQYGYSDFAADFPGLNQSQVWAKMRLEWLDRVNWNDDALRQLADNLELDRLQLLGDRKQ